jgi:hypothetical protein
VASPRNAREPWIGSPAPDGADALRCRLRRPQEKKKKPKGRAYKRLQVRRAAPAAAGRPALTLKSPPVARV